MELGRARPSPGENVPVVVVVVVVARKRIIWAVSERYISGTDGIRENLTRPFQKRCFAPGLFSRDDAFTTLPGRIATDSRDIRPYHRAPSFPLGPAFYIHTLLRQIHPLCDAPSAPSSSTSSRGRGSGIRRWCTRVASLLSSPRAPPALIYRYPET